MTHEEELNKAAGLWIAGVFLAYSVPDTSVKELREIAEKSFIAGAKWGYEQAEKDLGWHSVKESLPPMDEEVIVLSDIINGKEVHGACCISFGHIVDKRYCVDYDGWNIPGIHHWMPCPKINGKELGLITKEDL